MKTIAYLWKGILILAIFCTVSCSENGRFELLDGKQKSIDDYKGKWLIVNFWAEWCAPCIEEIEDLNLVFHNTKTPDVTVVGVSYDQLDNSQLRETVRKLEIQYPVMATNPVPILPFGLPPTLPTNYIISPEGEVVAKLVGTQNFEKLYQAIESAKKSNLDNNLPK